MQRHVSELIKDYNNYVEKDGNTEVKKIAPELLGVIPTMVGIRGEDVISTQKQYLNDIVEKMKMPVLGSKIRENKTIYADAPLYGVPVILDSQKSQLKESE